MRKWLLFAVCLLLPAPASARQDDLTFNTEEYPPYNYLTEDGEIGGESTRLLRAVQLYLACHPSVPEAYVARLQAAIDRLRSAESVEREPRDADS